MKLSLAILQFGLRLVPFLAATLASPAATFTNDTSIGISNTNFDGLDIVVTNATLTVDGTHSFASVRLLGGGRLTHSFATNGLLENRISIAGELHSLSSTNPATLSYMHVQTNSIVVTGLSGAPFVNGIDYGVSNSNNTTILSLIPGSAIPEGATISVNYDALLAPVPAGFHLTIRNDFEIESGGAIDADGRGYGGGKGPGAGGGFPTNYPYSLSFGGGGGHGGYGAPSSAGDQSPGSVNGSLTKPAELGSGGGGSAYIGGAGTGGAGGGLIDLTIGGLLRVDGRITANGASGTNFYSGGGSGGGMFLSAQILAGSGSITADGGDGESPDGGGGGGGRIAIYDTTNQFGGLVSAYGGGGSAIGGAGTIYTSAPGASAGRVVIDNGGRRGASTLLVVSNNLSGLTITSGRL